MSPFKNVNVVQINVSDWQRAKQFYGDLLDWPQAYVDEQIGWCEWGQPNETHLAINRWNDQWGPLPTKGQIAVLAVDDAHATTVALRAKGIACDDIMSIPGMVDIGAFHDPDGNTVQFASRPAAA